MMISFSFIIISSVLILCFLIFEKMQISGMTERTMYTLHKLLILQLLPVLIPITINKTFSQTETALNLSNTQNLQHIYSIGVIVCLTFGALLLLKTTIKIYNIYCRTIRSNDYYSHLLKRKDGTSHALNDIAVLETEAVCFPFSFHLLHSYIILPKWQDVNEDMLFCILQHELTHLRKRDSLWRIIAFVVCAFQWFNPLAWYLFVKMSDQCELACDEITLEQIGSQYKDTYLQSILYCCEYEQSRESSLGIVPFPGNHKQSLKERMNRIMISKKKKIGIGVVCGILLVSGCIAAHIVFRPSDSGRFKYTVLDENDNIIYSTEYYYNIDTIDEDGPQDVYIERHSDDDTKVEIVKKIYHGSNVEPEEPNPDYHPEKSE